MSARTESKARGKLRTNTHARRRIGRITVAALAACTLAAAVVLLYLGNEPSRVFAEPETCEPPTPLPGPARHWEVGLDVSTYTEVNTHHGNAFTAIPIVSWSGIGPDLDLMLYHNSATAASGYNVAEVMGFNLGPGWSISYSDHLRLDQLPNKVTVVAADGTQNVYTWSSYQQRWVPPGGVHDELTQVDSTTWRVKAKDQSFREFVDFPFDSDSIPRLWKVADATGNEATVSWEFTDQQVRRMSRVQAAGRDIDFEFETLLGPEFGFLRTIVDPWDGDGGTHERRWTLEYDDGAATNYWLKFVEDAMDYELQVGYKNKFTYDAAGRLASISDKYDLNAGGFPNPYTYTYTNGRLTQAAEPSGDGGGRTQTSSYVCYQPSEFEKYTRTTYVNRHGASWLYVYPEGSYFAIPANAGTLSLIDDPLGQTSYMFDGDKNLLSFTDGNYNQWEATYDSRGNVLTLEDPLSHTRSWTYDALNNATSHTDAEGNVVRYYYDDAAFPTLLTRIVEPNDAGSPPPGQPPGQEGTFPATRLTYFLVSPNACTTLPSDNKGCHGQLESVTDPNEVWTGFEYDQWGQQARYIEGRWASQVAGGGWNEGNWYAMTPGSDGNGQSGSTSGGMSGTGGSSDSNGNPTSSPSCLWLAVGGGGPSSSWPPFPVPCDAPSIPQRHATFELARYTTMSQLLDLPLNLGFGTRRHLRTYDVMHRPLVVAVEEDDLVGTPFWRTFTHAYDDANHTYARTGPDGVETFVQLNGANLPDLIRRGPVASPLMTAGYLYHANGDVDRITYGNGTAVQYYYDRHRLLSIEHLRVPSTGERLLRLDYEYTNRDLPWRITEYGQGLPGAPAQALTTFAYDRRARLTRETRVYFPSPGDPAQNYDLEYQYDAGGNRTRKFDYLSDRRVEYHYDVEAGADPNVYGSLNNRLMGYETFDTTDPDWWQTISKTYYVYTYDSTDARAGKTDGNPTRIMTEYPAEGGIVMAMSSAETTTSESSTMLVGGGNPCDLGETYYTTVRLGYAQNGSALTFAHGESWCWNGLDSCSDITDYTVTWAREFRYDGARARYLDRDLDGASFQAGSLVELDATWSDYDDDEIYGDFTVVAGNPPTITPRDSYQPGLWRSIGTLGTYLHNDHLGTLRGVTFPDGTAATPRLFTAFGERKSGTHDRFGYVGAWGYQAHPFEPEFDFLHIGHRYYDPASGRFLQRDPIGIEAGPNVFEYVESAPTNTVDPYGFCVYCEMPLPKVKEKDGSKGAWLGIVCGRFFMHVVKPWWEELNKKPKMPPFRPGPPAPGWCFVEGTKVLTPDGPVPIEEIEVGTIIVTHDGPCGDAVERSVIRVIHGEATEVVTVSFEAESVACTRRHPFYVVDRGWVEAGDLREGDLVPTATGELKEISALTIEALPNAVRVYNLQVEQHHYYFVGDGNFLVHNGKM